MGERGTGEMGVVERVNGKRLSRRDFCRLGVGALASGLPTGCIPEPTGPSDVPDSGRLTVLHHAPTLAAPPGETWLELSPVRDGLLYVPAGYDPAVPAPLLVTLHGAGGGADDWAAFHAKCEARGMLMLAVESRGYTWDRVSGSFGSDVVYIDAAIGWVFDRCNVDVARIALAGFSDGASYALSLGPTNGNLFTHLIAFSPGFTWPSRERVGWPRIWISHGASDPVLPERNTSREIVPALRDMEYEVTYTRFDGGHEVPAEISNAALDWFLG